jgi:protein O-mannosyl-transferase
MTRRWKLAIELAVIALLATALYAPFLGNPRVFDDRLFFSGQRLVDFATTPFGLETRLPAYFSLAFVEVLWPHMEAHRILSLVIHIACAWVLCRLAQRLLGRASWLALLGATVFALHPAAVYAAGYLVQRSIVLATLFSLLSILLFVRGLERRSFADACSAALMYWIAVLSKEHAVLLPAAAVMAVVLRPGQPRFSFRYAAVYLLACAPVAVFVVLYMKNLIGTPYEAAFDAVAAQVDASGGSTVEQMPWLASAIVQMGLFFRYLAVWLLPSTQSMAIDLRVDFAASSSLAWAAVNVLAFFGYAAGGLFLLRRGGRVGLVGFGLLYPWILFLVELSSVRFQEPLVLYRSYLWAPGIIVALCAGLSYLPRKIALAAPIAAMPLLFLQANDRLQTFSSPLALWQDAADKLQPGVPGGYRTLFQLGREVLYAGEPQRAIAVADRCIAGYPETPECWLARGTVLLQMERYKQAVPYLTRAIELDPRSGIAHHHRALALQELGQRKAAVEEYRASAKLGFGAAAYRLRLMKEPEEAR